MKNIPSALAIFSLLAIASHSWAEPLSFNALTSMDVPLGAKAEALGGAFASCADDSSAIYWNPAGLAWQDRAQVQATYNQWMLDSSYDDVTGTFPLAWGTLGARFSYLDFGTFDQRDDYGYKTGNLQAQAWGGSVAASRRFGNYGFGAAAKLYQESGDGGPALTGYALDAGFLGKLDRFSFGAGVRNLGMVTAYSLPTAFYAGVSKKADFHAWGLLALTDLSIPRGGNATLHHGLELEYRHSLFLRAGYQWTALKTLQEAGSGFCAGAGIRVRSFQVDYSLTPDTTFGWTHKVTMGYLFTLRPANRADPKTGDSGGTDSKDGDHPSVKSGNDE